MEQKIYDVLCEIRDEISNLNYEISLIRGVNSYSKDLYDVYDLLDDIYRKIN